MATYFWYDRDWSSPKYQWNPPPSLKEVQKRRDKRRSDTCGACHELHRPSPTYGYSDSRNARHGLRHTVERATNQRHGRFVTWHGGNTMTQPRSTTRMHYVTTKLLRTRRKSALARCHSDRVDSTTSTARTSFSSLEEHKAAEIRPMRS